MLKENKREEITKNIEKREALVEQVAEGIWRIGVELPQNPLRELNSYLIKGKDVYKRQDEICVREIRFSELPELQMQEMRETVQSAGQYALHRLDATLSIEDPQHNGISQWRILTRAQVLYSDGNTADVKIGNLEMCIRDRVR